jgi:hypothetical protein
MNNNSNLRRIMRDHRLRRQDVATLTGRSLNAVASWLRSPTTSGFRNMPKHALELLESKIKGGTA